MKASLHIKFLFVVVLPFYSVIEANIHGVLVNKRACRGGPAHFNATGGTITSPLHPQGPPRPVSCSWILHNPHRDTLILSFSLFDLDQNTKCGKRSFECCPHQWLMIKTNSHSVRERRETRHISLVTNSASQQKNKIERNQHSSQDDKEAESLRNKWLRLFQNPILNSTFGDFLTINKPPHQQESLHLGGNDEYNDGRGASRVCGKSAPVPLITTQPRVTIKFYSDKMVESGHMGFKIEYQISNNMTICNEEEFRCNDPQLCVPKSWRCNGQTECPDSSDEADCQVGCAGLTDNQHCDGRWHCPNGEDELGCFGCESDELWCGEDTDCYKVKRRCDGIPDCRNRADEVYCNCFNQTRCGPNSEFCYDPKTQGCDGILHCPNGHDEMDCGGHCPHMIACGHGGVCYTSAQRCDGVAQCGDGSDEASCTPQLCHPQHGAFLCANHRCIRDTWRCDQFDDCGDASDEEDCLRNSVIVAAAMGGLVCSLLLVIAVGCTCRLYALRIGLTRYRQQGQRGGRRSTPLAPLSRLEQHLLQREPPPSYSVAVNDPSAALFGSRRISRQWRRQRRRPPPPPEGVLPPLPVPIRGHVAPGPPHPYDTGPGQTSNLRVFTSGNNGRRNSRSSDEKESEEEAKPLTSDPAPHTSAQHTLPVNTVDDDVPLLSAVDGEVEARDDAPLLEIGSTSSLNTSFDETDDDDAMLLCADFDGRSYSINSEEERTEEEIQNLEVGVDIQNSLCVLESIVGPGESVDSVPVPEEFTADSSAASEEFTADSSTVPEELRAEEAFLVHFGSEDSDVPAIEGDRRSLPRDEGQLDSDTVHLESGTPDTASLLGDVMTDTRAAVLALSIVQRHTEDVRQADTELTSQ